MPAPAMESHPEPIRPRPGASSRGSFRAILPILVVEPSRRRGPEISRLLRDAGFPVTWTTSADRAAEALAAPGGLRSRFTAWVVALGPGQEAGEMPLLAPFDGSLPTVLVVDAPSAGTRRWAAARGAALVEWGELEESLAPVVESVLTRPRPAPAAPAVAEAPTAERDADESWGRDLQGILSCVGSGVFGVDGAGRITFINEPARRILGWEREEGLEGLDARSLFHYALEDDREVPVEDCPLAAAYRSGSTLRDWDTLFVHRSGRPVPVECSVHPFTFAGQSHGSIVTFFDISERRHLYDRAWWMATHDLLTSLHNRRYFEEQLGRELERLRQEGGRSALLLFDIDHFRMINELAGPQTGDRVLVEVGRELEHRLGDHDALARLGDDSFAVVVRDVDETSACQAGEGLRQALSECGFDHEGQSHRVGASLGIVLVDRYSPPAGVVVANAELACHLAKKDGQGRVCFHREQSNAQHLVLSQFGWPSRLRYALQRGGFTLHFQPILPMPAIPMDDLPREPGVLWRTRRPAAGEECFEVLIRLRDGQGGVILPADFLPTAERFDLMTEIDLWVIREALEKLANLHAGGRRATFFINLSGQTLGTERLQPFVRRTVRELGLDPACLVFEITENDAIQNLDSARSVMEEMQELGCRFALDDFGSGYSSFRHLKHLPVDILKIDGMFVRGMAADGPDLAMVASMDEIAHSLGRRTVAESVEDAATLRLLQQCGVDYVQGHYICRPLASLEPA